MNFTYFVVILALLVEILRLQANEQHEKPMHKLGAATTSERSNCEKGCQICNNETVSCQNLALTDLKTFQNYSDTLMRFIFTGNNLGPLAEPIFTQSMSFLSYLDLSDNKITSLNSSRVFANLPFLDELILGDNDLDFEGHDQLSSMKELSATLTKLSMSHTKERHHGSENKLQEFRVRLTYAKVIKLLTFSRLSHLESLKLEGLSIRRVDINQVNLDEQDHFLDVLCQLPNLRYLSFERNLIDTFNLDTSCLRNSNSASNLNEINLSSNRLATIDQSSINKLRDIKSRNANFSVNLSGNNFKCDCTLYAFYLFLRGNDSIVQRAENLQCKDPSSLEKTLNKAIVNSGLDKVCSATAPNSEENSSETTSLQKTSKNPKQNRVHTAHSVNRLFIFLMSVIILSSCILLMLKIHLGTFLRQRFHWYRTLSDRPSNNRLNFSGNEEHVIENVTAVDNPYSFSRKNNSDNSEGVEDRFLYDSHDTIHHNQPRKYSFASLFKFRRLVNSDEDQHSTDAPGPVRRFDYLKTEQPSSSGLGRFAGLTALSANKSIMGKRRKLTVNQVESSEDSDKEEILMSTINESFSAVDDAGSDKKKKQTALYSVLTTNVMSTRLP
jgi:hypothetical protein